MHWKSKEEKGELGTTGWREGRGLGIVYPIPAHAPRMYPVVVHICALNAAIRPRGPQPTAHSWSYSYTEPYYAMLMPLHNISVTVIQVGPLLHEVPWEWN